MKLNTPEIVWHNKEPVFTVDFHRNGPNWRLVTGGADNDVRVWKVVASYGGVNITFLSSLSRHTRAVNVVRFSPSGTLLASAGDDRMVLLWTLDIGNTKVESNLCPDDGNKENWSVVKMLQGHLEDIYDLCWSHDSNFIVTGSVDNSAIIWDVQKGRQVAVLKDSKQYVQGVCWDPQGKVVVTLSNDRTLRVYGTDSHFKCLHSISKLSTQSQEGDAKQCRMWIDEGLNSFFRRLSFTPDGSFLIAPAGRYEVADKSKHATYVFSRSNWTRPVLQLPGPEKATIVVKCCPIPFQLKLEPESSLTSLPYRMVYAVASLDSVLFYDTQHLLPFAYVSNIHYSGITDLAWSNDGLILIVSSSDCYCSFVTFDPNELGTPLDTSVMFSTTAARENTTPLRTPPSPPPLKQRLASDSPHSDSSVARLNNDINGDATAFSDLVVHQDNRTKPLRRIRPTMISGLITSPVPISTTIAAQVLQSEDNPSVEMVGDEMVGDEIVGDEVVGDEVVGDEMVGDEVVGDEMVGDEVVGDKMVGDEVVGDEMVGDEVVGDEMVGDAVVGDEMVGDEVVGDEVVGDEVVGDEMVGNNDVYKLSSEPPPPALPKNSDTVGVTAAYSNPPPPPPRRVNFITLSSFKKTNPDPVRNLEQQ